MVNAGDGLRQLRPADFLAELVMHFRRHLPHARADGSERNSQQSEVDAADQKQSPLRAIERTAPDRTRCAQPYAEEDAAAGQKRRIERRGVVRARAGDGEEGEGDHEGPAQHAVAPGFCPADIEPQAEERERRGDDVDVHEQLLAIETAVTALAQVSRMQMGEEIERNELMARLPDEGRKEKEDGERDADPKPFPEEITPRGGEQNSGHDAEGEKTHGVARFHAEAERDTDGHPPARVSGFEQAQNEVGCENAPKIAEGNVLHDRGLGERERRDSNGDSGKDLCAAASAEFASHQARENGDDADGYSSKKPEADQGGAEESEFEPGDQRGKRRVDDIAPVQMAGVVERLEFIAMEAVLAVGQNVKNQESQRDKNENAGIRRKRGRKPFHFISALEITSRYCGRFAGGNSRAFQKGWRGHATGRFSRRAFSRTAAAPRACAKTADHGWTLVTPSAPGLGKCLSYQAMERSVQSIWCLVSERPWPSRG